MQYIIKLMDWMDEEIEMAEKYAKAAEHCAEEKNTSHVSAYSSMARQELEHYEKLHHMILDKIAKKSDDKATHDIIMQMYECKHKWQAKEIAEIRYMLESAEKF